MFRVGVSARAVLRRRVPARAVPAPSPAEVSNSARREKSAVLLLAMTFPILPRSVPHQRVPFDVDLVHSAEPSWHRAKH